MIGGLKRRRRWRAWRLACFGVCVLASTSSSAFPFNHAPPDEPSPIDQGRLAAILEHPQLVVVRGANGEFVAKFCRCGLPVGVRDIPDKLRWALIDTEDRRFYAWYHGLGIDPVGVAAALVQHVPILGGFLVGKRRGGSSLEQQIAKNLVGGGRSTLARKLHEIPVAYWMDRHLTKDEIVALYLDTADFGARTGRSIIGIQQAAHAYYGKTVEHLNLYEIAVLVGMLNAPTRFSPALHPGAARLRATLVLRRMVQADHIDHAAMEAALRTGPRPGTLQPIAVHEEYYVAWVLRTLEQRRRLYAGYHELRVVIGLDPAQQRDAQNAVSTMLEQAAAERDNARQAALIAMGPDGLVHALIGGNDFRSSQFDRATMARRQPGSAFKPFVYLRALEMGRNSSDKILDAPFTRAESRKYDVPVGWPANFGGRYEGRPVSLREALADSLNAATVRLAVSVGLSGIVDIAHRLGINSDLRASPSLGLGSSAVTPIELTGAYAAFLNRGRRVEPHGTIAVLLMDGTPVSADAGGPGPQVVAPRLTDVMSGMLHDAVRFGTGWRSQFGGWSAGKTGTTQHSQDAWFTGLDRDAALVTTVWIGNDDNEPMSDRVSGGTLPAEAWRRFYLSLTPRRPPDAAAVARR